MTRGRLFQADEVQIRIEPAALPQPQHVGRALRALRQLGLEQTPITEQPKEQAACTHTSAA